MNLKDHIKTTYNIKDIKRKLFNLILKIYYKCPYIKNRYDKKIKQQTDLINSLHPLYVVKICEGFGNQMFQYAFAKSLNKKTGIKTILNIHSFNKLYRNPYRLYGLNIKGETVDIEFNPKTEGFSVVQEETPYIFEKSLFEKEPSTYFNGYFQSYKYFDDIKNELMEDFEIKAKFTQEYKEIEDLIKNTESVLLNFRVGADYKRLGWMIDYSYQKEAVLKMKELLPDKKLKFFIFADNIKEIKKHFKIEPDMEIVDLGKNNPDKIFLDLKLMKECKHDIITNSSYSFWAAYLNKNMDKKVIAPIPWFFNEDEMTPPDWIRLKADKIKVKNPEII